MDISFLRHLRPNRVGAMRILEAAPEPRFLTLVNATGKVRRETWNGEEYVVVPVVALVEGVIHPVNAPTPELVMADVFKDCAGWEGQPLHAGHPMKGGVPVSGHLPDVLPLSFGVCRNATSGERLGMEAWIAPSKCAAGKAKRILERATAEPPLPIEVSVGVFVNAAAAEGEHKGRRYKAKWLTMKPDHLALLDEDKRGACDVVMGCGTHRVAEAKMRVAEDGTLVDLGSPDQPRDENGRWTDAEGAFKGALDAQSEAFRKPTAENHEKAAAAWQQSADFHRQIAKDEKDPDSSRRIRENGYSHEDQAKWHRNKARQIGMMIRGASAEEIRAAMPRGWSNTEVADGLREALNAVEPSMAAYQGDVVSWTDSRVVYCIYPPSTPSYTPVPNALQYFARDYKLDGDKFTLSDRQPVEPTMTYPTIAESVGELKAACGCGNPKPGIAAPAAGAHMKTKAERIAALVANPHSPVKDVKVLEGLTDEAIAALEASATALKTAEEAQQTALTEAKTKQATAEAALKAAQEAPKAFKLEDAPQEIRDLVANAKAADTAKKDGLVGQLKAAQSAFSEDDLKGMEIPALEKLATAMKVAPKPDYSGIGTPRIASASEGLSSFAAPNSYAPAAK